MDTISASLFRVIFPDIAVPTVVTKNGEAIGTWYPAEEPKDLTTRQAEAIVAAGGGGPAVYIPDAAVVPGVPQVRAYPKATQARAKR